MRFMHLGDLHLGKSLGDFDLYEDQQYLLNEVIRIIDEEQVNALLIAGDVYDRALPSEKAVNLLDDFLARLRADGIMTFIISGNHDSDDRLNFGSRLFEKNDIYISSRFDGKLYKQTVQDEYGEIDIFLLPFVKSSAVRYYYPDENINTYDDAVRTVIRHADIDMNRRSLLVAHQFVAGEGINPIVGGSEGVSVRSMAQSDDCSVGTVERIGYKTLECFDYVALGHIHSAQKVGIDTIRYSGSLMKYSLSEASNDKTATIIDIEEKGDVRIREVPLKPLRDFRHLKTTFAELISKDNLHDTDDYIFVTLTDEEIINDAMNKVQQYYPRTVKLSYDNSHTRNIGEADEELFTQEKTFIELFSEFYTNMYGCDMPQDELKIILDIAKEVGIDEAN